MKTKKMKQLLYDLIDKFGMFIIGGIIGAIIHRFRNTMSLKKFIAVLFISAFVGVIVGIVCRNYLNVNEEVTFAIVSTIGVFSKDILDIINDIINQIKKIVSMLNIFVVKYINKKLK